MLLFLVLSRTIPRRTVELWIWQSRRVFFSCGYVSFLLSASAAKQDTLREQLLPKASDS